MSHYWDRSNKNKLKIGLLWTDAKIPSTIFCESVFEVYSVLFLFLLAIPSRIVCGKKENDDFTLFWWKCKMHIQLYIFFIFNMGNISADVWQWINKAVDASICYKGFAKFVLKKKKKKEETDFELKDNALDGVITLIMMNWYFEKDNAAHTTICHVNLKKN